MFSRKKIPFFFCFLLYFHCGLLHGNINWSAPVTISSSNLNASDPQVVIDTQGNATAAWVENSLIRAGTQPFNGSWGAPSTLSDGLVTASTPKLGIDSSGNVTALWLEGGIIYSSTTVAGIWGIGLPISSLLGGASSPALSVDSSGNAVAVWVRGGVIESATRSSGVWGSVSTLSGASSDYPQVAISANGTVIAVWHRVVSGADVIQSATKTINGSWTTAKSVFNGIAALKHGYPQVAIDPNGNVAVVWFRYNYSGGAYQNVNVLSSFLTFNASNWTIPSILSNPGLRNPADLMLKIAFDPNGNVIAFWTNSYDGQLFYVESTAMRFGGSWGGTAIPHGPNLYSFTGDIAVNSLGNVLATYMTWDGSLLKIQSQESNIGNPIFSSWSIPNSISQGSDNGYPRCAIALNGSTSNAVVVWINFNGAHNIIQASTGSETVISPPVNLSVVQNVTTFVVYNDYYNTFSWEPSPSSGIIQYNIYRNGIFFAATDPNTLQIIDHNAGQNVSVTYGVAAMDSNFTQSSIATNNFP